MIKVEGYDNLYRSHDGSIINTDRETYNAFMQRHEAKLKEIERINNLEKTVKDQADKLDDILNILRKLTDGNS